MTAFADKKSEATTTTSSSILRNRRRSSNKTTLKPSSSSSINRRLKCTWSMPEDDDNILANGDDDEPSSPSINSSQVHLPKFRRGLSRRHTFSAMNFSADDDDDDDDDDDNNNGDSVSRIATVEERVLDIIDHIEDDITRQSWMQYLIPKRVNSFFENYMLGWNLGSDVLNGVLCPLMCAGVTFGSFTFFAVRFGSGGRGSGMGTSGFLFPMRTMMTLDSPFLDLLRISVTWLSANISYRTVDSLGTVILGSKKPEDVADATTLMEKLKNSKKPPTFMEKLKKRRIKNLAFNVDKRIRDASDKFETNFNNDLDSTTAAPVNNTFHTLSEPLTIVPYSHGGYFGSAPIMMNDPHWIDILRTLMPDVYVEVASRIDHPPSQLIHWAENNPVVAAYGTWTELKKSGRLTPIEWDVFLDPGMVARLEALLNEMESSGSSSSPRRSDLEQDVSRCTSLLLDKMMIAHGNTFQLVLEQTGIFKRYVYSRVKRTRRALGGGIFAKHWLAVYARALEMVAMKEEEEEEEEEGNNNVVTAVTKSDDFTSSVTACRPYRPSFSRHISLHSLTYNIVNPNMTIEQSLHVLSTLLLPPDDDDDDDDYDSDDDDENNIPQQPTTPPLSLVLDVKSRFIPQRIWARIVNLLRSNGAEVNGIGSFVPDEIHGIGRLTDVPVGEWIFGHTAGDIQKLCHEGKLRVGDVVFFNAGSLLWDWDESRWGVWRWVMEDFDQETFKKSYKVRSYANFDDENEKQQPQSSSDTALRNNNRRGGSTLKDYKDAYQLSIGLYLQEFAIDECAVDFLFRFVNKHADIFDRGMAWGCPSGVTVDGIYPSKFTSTDGLWSQRFAGAKWDANLFPES